MEDLVIGALVGALLTEVIGLVKNATRCKKNCKKLEATLNSISQRSKKMVGHRDENYQKWLKELEDLLEEAKKIIKKYCVLNLNQWKSLGFTYLKNANLNSKILDIDTRIKEHISTLNMEIIQAIHDLIKKDENGEVNLSSGFIPRKLPNNIVSFENDPFQELKALIMAKSDGSDPATLGLRGIGGSGKTLVAQMLHNDKDIGEKYGVESLLWITIG